MLLRLLESPLFQVVVFVGGSIVVWRILKRFRAERRKERRESRPLARRAQPAFRDLRWGEALRPEMILYHDGADEQLFTRPNESLKIGDAPVTSIFYSYYLGRLQAVMIEMPHRSSKEVLETMSGHWGEPFRFDPAVPRFTWNEITGDSGAMKAVLDDTPSLRYASLVMTSQVVAEERRARGRRRTPLGSLSGAKAEREKESATSPGRRTPLGALSGSKARREDPPAA